MKPADFQQTLRAAGFDPVWIDGLWGAMTAEATEAWFRSGRDIPIVAAPGGGHEAIDPIKPGKPPLGEQTMSHAGVDFLIGWEGEKLTAYRDPAGIWTIGCGHTSAAGPPEVYQGMTITHEESRIILARDLKKFESGVRKEFGGYPIAQYVFDGAVSFHYNTGAIGSASWPDYWKAGDYPTSEKKLKEWNKAGGKVSNGLVKRREAESDMIFRQDYSGRP